MNKSKNVPKIRFEGFSGEWENKKLGEIFLYEQPNKYIVSIANYSDDYKIPVLTAGQSFILGYTNEGYGIKNASKDFPVIIFDDFTTSSHYVDFPFKVKSSAMKILTTDNKKYSFYYLYTVLKNINYKPICHERQWISIFSNFNILIPKLKEEQKLIGQYFSNIDNLIKLQQQKYEKLLNLKKSLLYKLFPKEGETVPELRFEGFSGKWENRKVCDIANRFDNLRIPVAANLRVPGSTPYYGANGIQDYVEGYTHEGEFVLVAEDGANDLKNYPVKHVKGRIWVNNHAHVLQAKVNIADNQFLKFCIIKSDVESLLVGGGRSKLNAETMMDITLMIPSIEEQRLIGDYIAKLEDLITFHQQKLEKLKNVKESLLDKMFV